MKVKSAMHQGVTCVGPATPVPEIARQMRDGDIGAIPVSDDGHLLGMITDRDIACRAVANGGDIAHLTARDVMSKNVVSCREDDDLDDAVRVMKSKAVRRLPVTDGKANLVGMLSLGDVSQMAARTLSGELLRAISAHHQ